MYGIFIYRKYKNNNLKVGRQWLIMLNWTKEQIAAVKKLLAKWGIKLNSLQEDKPEEAAAQDTKEEN